MFVIQWFILQIKFLKNRFKEEKRRFLSVNLLKTVIFIFGLALFYFFLIWMFDSAIKRQMPAFDFACILLSFSLLVFLPLLTFSAIVCALTYLFQKEEISFYFSLPINRIQVFTIKFWQTFLCTTWMCFCGLFVFLLSLQRYFRLPILVYVSGILAALLYLIIPVCIGVIITLVLSRFIPFVRAKGVLTVIGLLVGSLLLLIIRLMQPERLVSEQGRMRLLTFMDNLHKPLMTVFPSEWLTNILAAHYYKDTAGFWLNFLILLMVATILLVITYLLAKAFYVHVWSESIAVPEVGSKKSGWQILLKIFPSSLRTLVKKDLLSFYRDTVERGSLLIFIPLAFIYFYSIHLIHRHVMREFPQEIIFSFLYLYLFNLFYSAIVICGLSGRWTFPSISSESNNFKLIKLAPITLGEFLKEKFWLGFLPLLILGEILVVGSCLLLGISLAYIAFAFFVTAILTLGIVAIGVILGARAADFSIKEPLEFALSHEGLIYLVWALIYVGAIILLVAIPLVQFLRGGFCLWFILTLIFSLALMILIFYGLSLGYKRAIICLSKRDV